TDRQPRLAHRRRGAGAAAPRRRRARLDGHHGDARRRRGAGRRPHRLPARRPGGRRDRHGRRGRAATHRRVPGQLSSMFAALAKLVSRYPRWVLAAWFVLAAGSLPLGMRLGEVLTGQPEAPGSGDAAAVRRVLGARFAQAEEEALVAVAHGAGTRAGTPEYDAALDEVQVRLLLVDHVTYVRDHRSPTGLVLL